MKVLHSSQELRRRLVTQLLYEQLLHALLLCGLYASQQGGLERFIGVDSWRRSQNVPDLKSYLRRECCHDVPIFCAF